jgi:hypothetical protein
MESAACFLSVNVTEVLKRHVPNSKKDRRGSSGFKKNGS